MPEECTYGCANIHRFSFFQGLIRKKKGFGYFLIGIGLLGSYFIRYLI